MRRGVILGAVPAVLLRVAAAQAATPRPIVYAVVIDGLDGDRVDEGKAPFISSLLDGHATYYGESRSVMIAETNPNHAAMMTGAYGNTSGFPGNAFALYAPLANASTCQAPGPADESKAAHSDERREPQLRSGHRYRIRVRMRAASGVPGRWASRGVRLLRCLRAPRARPGHGRR